MYALFQVTSALVGALLTYTATLDRKGPFWLHPAGMSIAFLICLPSAIEFMKQRSGAWQGKKPSTPILRHLFLHSISFITSAIGFAAIYLSKEQRNKPHFATWHGKLGLACLILFLLTSLGGIKDLFAHGLVPWRNDLHKYFAKSVYFLICVECVLGLFSSWGLFRFGKNGAMALSAAVAGSMLGVLFLNGKSSKVIKL